MKRNYYQPVTPAIIGFRTIRKFKAGQWNQWQSLIGLFSLALALLLLGACSVKRTAVNIIGNALAGSGTVYASDDDPELILVATPFGLKMFEGLLSVSPENRRLLLAAARGFTSYAYLLQEEADRIDSTDLSKSRRLQSRAHNLYLRGRDYALRGLDVEHPNFTAMLHADKANALATTVQEDVPFLYWAGASWAGALTAAKDDLDLIAELPIAAALMERILELDENYDLGAAHEFFISYEGNSPGGSVMRAREHYRRAVEISGGLRASIHVALAQAVSIRNQDLTEFRALIAAANAIDPDKVPHLRLANTVAKRRARWLESRIPELFLQMDKTEEKK